MVDDFIFYENRIQGLVTVVIAGLTFKAGKALGSYRVFGKQKRHKKVNASVSSQNLCMSIELADFEPSKA